MSRATLRNHNQEKINRLSPSHFQRSDQYAWPVHLQKGGIGFEDDFPSIKLKSPALIVTALWARGCKFQRKS